METEKNVGEQTSSIYDRMRVGKTRIMTMIWGDGCDNWL